jgi:hypothetical protein
MIKRLRRRRWLIGVSFAALVVVPMASAANVRIASVDTSGFPALRATLVAPLGAKAPRLRENGRPVAGYEAVNLGREKAARERNCGGPRIRVVCRRPGPRGSCGVRTRGHRSDERVRGAC